jgi:hypothetical protein
LRRYGITELQPGQTVLVRFGPGPKGMMASEIHPDGGPQPFASHYSDRIPVTLTHPIDEGRTCPDLSLIR